MIEGVTMSDVIWIVLSAVFAAYSVYLKVKINAKNSQGLSLDEELQNKQQDLKEALETKKAIVAEYESTQKSLHALIEMDKNSTKLEAENSRLQDDKEQLIANINSLKSTVSQIASEIDAKNKECEAIKSDLALYNSEMNLVSLGHVPEPEYLFNNSDRYNAEIKLIRDQQAQMIKSNDAVQIPESIALIADNAYAKTVLRGQARLMLNAFNLECDALILNLKATNYPATLERIERIAGEIEKNSISLKCGLSNKYVELKYRECELQYQFKKLENEEKIEQAAKKEEMREEAKVRAEAERIQRETEREAEAVRRALEKAKNDFDKASDEQKSKFEAILANLQVKLKEAEEKNQRAISMAQQTRCGHVYIISNIGSFGENVFKIGMTRRLEPMDRVKELGDASVPFEFDVHAMIYSEDAPALEKKLHNAFGARRANLVNLRKEFFYVSLDDLEHWSTQQGLELQLTKLAEARSYKDSQAIRSRIEAGLIAPPVEIEDQTTTAFHSEYED